MSSITCYCETTWEGPTKKATEKSLNNYFLHTGYCIDVVLVNSIFSFNVLSPVIAETDSPQYFLEKVMLPAHTKFIGTAQIQKSMNRVNVTFNRIIFPDGNETGFSGMALEADGSAGLIGIIKDKKTFKIPAKVFLSAASSAASAAGASVTNDLIKSLSSETQTQLAQEQDYSIDITKGKSFKLFIVNRIEY
jgi:hypothetical protein